MPSPPHRTWPLLLLMLFLLKPQSVQCAADEDKFECTRKCLMDETQHSCWRQSLGFYSQQLEDAVQQYVGTLTHISRWNKINPQTVPYKVMAGLLAAKVIARAEDREAAEPLDGNALLSVFEFIMNKTAAVEQHYNDPEVVPVSFLCPIPCDYYPEVWMTLFFVTLVALLLMCISFFLYLIHQQLRTDQKYR